MLMNRIVCLLSTTLLFTFPIERNISPFLPTEQSIENKIDNNGMAHKDKFGLLINPAQEQFEKDKIEIDKKKAEELRIQKEKELKRIEEEKKKEQQLKEENQWQEFVLTFYTSLSSENGYGYEAITCTGAKLQDGMVASNYYKLGTEIHLENWGQVIVSDRGGNNFSNDYRLDVYIEREPNESDREYKKRVLNLGKKVVKGYIIK